MNIQKTLFTLLFAISLSSMVMACSTKATQETQSNSATEAVDINKVIAAYLTLKDALVASNVAVASEAATKLKECLYGNTEKLAKDAFDKATAIAESNNLDNQRALFYPLSESVLEMAITSKSKEVKLYKQYCPMAFDNQGAYWLSDSKDILNPYFGDAMLRCGMVQEKL